MRQRVGALVGPVAEKMWVSTFHSACVRILRRDAHARSATRRRSRSTTRPTPCASPATSSATSTSTRSGSRPGRCTPPSARPRTSGVGVEQYAERGAGRSSSASIAEVYREYQARLLHGRRHGLRRPAGRHRASCFREHPDVLEHYQQRFQHVLVDEYQDTNPAQNELVAAARRRAPQRLRRRRHRPVDLPLPRRRHPQHPRVRGGVPRRHRDRARAELPLDPDDPRRRQRGHRQQPRPQAQGAVDRPGPRRARSSATTPRTRATRRSGSPHEIAHLHDGGDHRWGDIAVFYRTNAQSRVVEEQLMRVGIPYKVVGGTRFYDRREIKDALAYLQAVVNPADEVSVKRVLNVPKRGVGDTTVGRLDAWAASPRHHVHRRAAPRRRGRRHRPGGQGHRLVPRRCSTRWRRAADDGPGRAARADRSSARGYLAELEAEHTDRGRRPAREPGRAGRLGPRVRVGRRVPRAGQPGGRHRRARRRRLARSC